MEVTEAEDMVEEVLEIVTLAVLVHDEVRISM